MSFTSKLSRIVPWFLLLACSASAKPEDQTGADASSLFPAPEAGLLPHGDSGAPSSTIVATVRDFKRYSAQDPLSNPDFENIPPSCNPCPEKGIVGPALGGDGKPTYAKAAGATLTTHGKASFDAWYRSVPGTNIEVSYPIALSPVGDGSYRYDSKVSGVALSNTDPTKNFFPIDDGSSYATPFGNQGSPHNYAFTVEMHTQFKYKGGEYFDFSGDDDVFVFIDRRLVIDLGGIHAPESARVEADKLGLTVGQTYSLDLFSAERHETQSNLLFTTTFELQPAPR